MTLSQNGINYICKNYGNSSECVVSTAGGLVFNYTDIENQTYTSQTASTSAIVAFITLGVVQSIQMTTPSRSAISNPQTVLNNANGSSISLADTQILAQHDETSGDQWCYIEPSDCSNPTGAEGSTICKDGFEHTCNGGVWVKTTKECGDDCSLNKTETACTTAGCHWYAYPNPFGEPECFSEPIYIKYLPFIAVGVGALIIVAALASSRKSGGYYPPPYGGRY